MFDHFTTLRMKVTLNEIINETKSLDESKASLSNDIPINVIKENYGIFATFSASSKITIRNKTISSSKCEKLLGIKINNN